MKKSKLLLIFALLAFSGMAQTQQPVTVVEVPAGETIEHCNAMISAIDIKVQYVLAHEDEKVRAEQNGWFEKMAHNRALYVSRKEYLVNHPENH